MDNSRSYNSVNFLLFQFSILWYFLGVVIYYEVLREYNGNGDGREIFCMTVKLVILVFWGHKFCQYF